MNVLFVCIANIGRSQVAEARFKMLSRHNAASAGTRADEMLAKSNPPTRKLKDAWGQRTVGYMSQFFVDVSEKERTQFTPEMVEQADRVIAIAEKETWPDYLAKSDKVTFWDIPDPLDMDDAHAYKILDDVCHRVEELVREIG